MVLIPNEWHNKNKFMRLGDLATSEGNMLDCIGHHKLMNIFIIV